jgi:outer membrane protein OmpA-like peptidoglycan-associated protein
MPRLGFLLLLLCSFSGGVRAAEDVSRRFVVFFPEWSAALDDAAVAVIADAAKLARAERHSLISIVGFADPVSGKQATALLSELRAQRVADQLRADGVAAARIHPIGHGPVRYAQSSLESRRVEIAIGGP